MTWMVDDNDLVLPELSLGEHADHLLHRQTQSSDAIEEEWRTLEPMLNRKLVLII